MTPLRPRPARSAAARVWGVLRAAARGLVDLAYPPHCLACGAATGGGDGLCAACWRALAFIERPYCDRLGLPFERDLGPGLLSPEAIAHPPVFRRARAAVTFDDGPARTLVHRLKYGDRHEVAGLMGRCMARAAEAGGLLADRPVLLPVPLHRGRLWRRQFNQAALLAREVARAADLRCDPSLLARVKPTATQVGMSRSARAANVQGAFRVPAGAAVGGRAVLLVDDVLTTGSTANAAARVLLRAGAASVDLLVFARVAGDAALTI